MALWVLRGGIQNRSPVITYPNKGPDRNPVSIRIGFSFSRHIVIHAAVCDVRGKLATSFCFLSLCIDICVVVVVVVVIVVDVET